MDQLLGADATRMLCHYGAIAQDRQVIRHTQDFVQVMANPYQGEALRTQSIHEVQQTLFVVVFQGTGWFIQQQHTHIAGQSACDFDDLLHGGR